ncbi:MAG: LysR family transcriptional regulator [Neisseriaceae bacterium]|nr:MAG: LysR family transcriptional regulator [Neisseriaceae bacterium]
MMFDHLITFVELVTTGNFSKTAECLKIAPSTLSRKIQELETYFGKTLITRDTRNFSLTTEGETLYQRFKSLPNQLAEAKQAINPEVKADSYPTLKIILPVIHALELITPYIVYFSRAYPEIKLNLFYMTWGKPSQKDVFDIAITVYPDKSGKFDQKFLRSEFVQLYCTPSYAIKYGLR